MQPRAEGKISEDEYQDLLGAMKKNAKRHTECADQGIPKPTRTSGLAIASLVLSVLPLVVLPLLPVAFLYLWMFGLVLGPLVFTPAIVCGYLARRETRKDPTVRGAGLALAGLIIGSAFLVLSMIPSLVFILSKTEYKATEVTVLKQFPLDSMEDILVTQSGIQIDKQISSDGNGSVRIEAIEPTTIRLFETGDIDIENASLIYQAHLRTAGVFGFVYLEMWCSFEGKGEFFSRGLADPLTGTTNWTTQEIMFRLKKGENPNNVKLNIVIDGKGTVWVDEIRLSALK